MVTLRTADSLLAWVIASSLFSCVVDSAACSAVTPALGSRVVSSRLEDLLRFELGRGRPIAPKLLRQAAWMTLYCGSQSIVRHLCQIDCFLCVGFELDTGNGLAEHRKVDPLLVHLLNAQVVEVQKTLLVVLHRSGRDAFLHVLGEIKHLPDTEVSHNSALVHWLGRTRVCGSSTTALLTPSTLPAEWRRAVG